LTRDSQLPPEGLDEPGDGQETPPRGRLATTGPGSLTAVFLVGLVAGRVLPLVVEDRGGVAPRVGWLPVLALLLVAAILGFVARSTYRTIHQEGQRLEPSQAVNRLVLGKSCAIAGALLTGGYLGYAISWIGQNGALEQERLTHSLLAAGAAALMVAGSLALERACRIRNGQNNK
jgi:hypothetical protein